MTLRQLKIFEAIANHLSVTKAADEIGISQPTVSKELMLLEEEFGVKLHVRVGRGIEITKAGADFHANAKAILNLVARIEKTLKRHVNTENRTPLVIAATESPLAWFLPRVLRAFSKAHPKTNIVLRASDPKGVEKLILNSDVEVAITTIASTKPQIISEAFRSEQVLAVISATSPLTKNLNLRQGVLGKIPLVARANGTIIRQLKQQGLRPNIVMQCESVSALKSAAKAGIGVAFLYRDVVQSELADGSLKVINIRELQQFDVKCFLIYRSNSQLSPEAKELIALLRRWPRKAPPAGDEGKAEESALTINNST